jgi:hypothetical protein
LARKESIALNKHIEGGDVQVPSAWIFFLGHEMLYFPYNRQRAEAASFGYQGHI